LYEICQAFFSFEVNDILICVYVGTRGIEKGRVLNEAEIEFIVVLIMEWIAGRGEENVDVIRDKLQLAARKVAGLKNEDLEKVIDLLTSLGSKEDD